MYASTITQLGQEYIAKCIANSSPLSFVKVKIGDGTLLSTEDPSLFTDIKSLKKEVTVSSVVASGNSALFTAQVDNTGVTTGYRATEIGIYVNDEGTEKLFWYVNQDIEASFLPPADRGYAAFEKAINIIVDSLETVILNWDGSQLWASKQELIENMIKTIEKITGCSYGGYIQDTATVVAGYVYLDKTMTAENIFYCYAGGANNKLNDASMLVEFTNKYLLSEITDLKENAIYRRLVDKVNSLYSGRIPFVNTDYTTEIGSALDFHSADGDMIDFLVRLVARTDGSGFNFLNSSGSLGILNAASFTGNAATSSKVATIVESSQGGSSDSTWYYKLSGGLMITGLNIPVDANYQGLLQRNWLTSFSHLHGVYTSGLYNAVTIQTMNTTGVIFNVPSQPGIGQTLSVLAIGGWS